MNIQKIELNIGLSAPVRVAHITDPHLALADERDPDLIHHAQGRTDVFFQESGGEKQSAESCFEEAMNYASTCDACVITGDVLDFISQKNLEVSDHILQGKEYLFATGNHEFCPRVGTPDSFALKEEWWGSIQAHFHNNMSYAAKTVGGVNLVVLDNGFYTFTDEQLAFLKMQIALGLPILVFCHVPLSDPVLRCVAEHKGLEKDESQKRTTLEMLDLIDSSPAVKAVIAGHYHRFSHTMLPCGKPQIITAGTFHRELTELILR